MKDDSLVIKFDLRSFVLGYAELIKFPSAFSMYLRVQCLKVGSEANTNYQFI